MGHLITNGSQKTYIIICNIETQTIFSGGNDNDKGSSWSALKNLDILNHVGDNVILNNEQKNTLHEIFEKLIVQESKQ